MSTIENYQLKVNNITNDSLQYLLNALDNNMIHINNNNNNNNSLNDHHNNDVDGKWIIINNNDTIRDAEDKYGRDVYLLRYSLTDNDNKPFDTMS